MRRAAAALVALAGVALCASGCSSSPEVVSASMVSPPRPAPSELAPDEGAGGPVDELPDDLGELPGMEEFGDELDEFGSQADDLFEQFEDELGVAGDCLDLLMKYAELVSASVGMQTAADPDALVADLRAAMPADLHDDLQIVADALEVFEREGFAGGAGAFTDPAFLDANDAITTWLTAECGGASGPGEGA